MLIYEIVERNNPFPTMGNLEVAMEVPNGNYHVNIPKILPDSIKDLMEVVACLLDLSLKRCFRKDPTERPNFELITEILEKVNMEETNIQAEDFHTTAINTELYKEFTSTSFDWDIIRWPINKSLNYSKYEKRNI